MLETRLLRELLLQGGGHLSAASGLVCIGDRSYVIADDELGLAEFDLAHLAQPGLLTPIFDGELPDEHKARKAAKPDLESLVLLPGGQLLALGSGSTLKRQRGALIVPGGAVRVLDFAPLLAPLRESFAELNIEGAFILGADLCLLQRGNGDPAGNACVRFDLSAVQRWLDGAAAAPAAHASTRMALGLLSGVPLAFTDGAALPDGSGQWLFSAAAEDTKDSYADGACAGSVIGLVGADGRILGQWPVGRACKVEGIAVRGQGLLMVTDADDRSRPGLLLSANWP